MFRLAHIAPRLGRGCRRRSVRCRRAPAGAEQRRRPALEHAGAKANGSNSLDGRAVERPADARPARERLSHRAVPPIRVAAERVHGVGARAGAEAQGAV